MYLRHIFLISSSTKVQDKVGNVRMLVYAQIDISDPVKHTIVKAIYVNIGP